MSDRFYGAAPVSAYGATQAFSAGLRSYMLRIYNYMGLALAISAVCALLTASAAVSEGRLTPFGETLFHTPLKWLIMLAPLGFVLAFGRGLFRYQLNTVRALFISFAAVNGVALSSILLVFAKSEVASAFGVTALTFGSMSLFGYVTKRDLTSVGSFAIMALWGIIIASLVNVFVGSDVTQLVISCVSVLVFVALTAYDTQKLKEIYLQNGASGEALERVAISGALSLYLDFINLFINILQIMRAMSDRR